jgi:hypothetical protein
MNPARGIEICGVADTGWYKDRIGCVDVTYVHGKLTEASFDHFLAETCRSIDECPDDEQVPILIEAQEPALMDSRWRRRLATALRERADKLRRTRPAYAMVTPSLAVRSALKVVHWASPPPYPFAVVSSLEEGFEFLARHMPVLDPRELRVEYERRRAAVLAKLGRG